MFSLRKSFGSFIRYTKSFWQSLGQLYDLLMSLSCASNLGLMSSGDGKRVRDAGRFENKLTQGCLSVRKDVEYGGQVYRAL